MQPGWPTLPCQVLGRCHLAQALLHHQHQQQQQKQQKYKQQAQLPPLQVVVLRLTQWTVMLCASQLQRVRRPSVYCLLLRFHLELQWGMQAQQQQQQHRQVVT